MSFITSYLSLFFLLIKTKGSDEKMFFLTSSFQTLGASAASFGGQPFKRSTKRKYHFSQHELDAQMKNWKLDVRFSSALSQRGPVEFG